MNEYLSIYLKSQSRNKVVFFKNDIPDLKVLDVGSKLANEIKPLVNDTTIGMKSLIIIDELFSKNIEESNVYGKYLAVSNTGILFEPELKIDFANLLIKHSFNNTLFVQWKGEVDNGNIYFLSKENGQKISINSISHITI